MKPRQGKFFLLTLALVALCGSVLPDATSAQATATLKGKFLYVGPPPAPAPAKIVVNADLAVCGKFNLTNQDLLVDQNGGIANVVVWLYTKGIKPAGDKVPANAAVLDNKGCHFEPHILVMRAGQPLDIKNSDTISHNTMLTPKSNPGFNQLIAAGATVTVANLNKAEKIPFRYACSIHTWMGGYVVLQDSPHVAVSAADGAFEITDLPTGQDLEFQVWQEKSGYVTNVTVGGKAEPWNFGRFKMTLNAGANDLGDIKVPAADF